MLRTLSLVDGKFGASYHVLRAFCGSTHSAVEHREEGVEAFRQQRVHEDRVGHVGGQRAPLAADLRISSQLGQAIPNGTVATYRFVDANSGVIESLKPRSGVTKNPLDIRHTFMPDLLYGSFRYIRKERAKPFRYCWVDENGVSELGIWQIG